MTKFNAYFLLIGDGSLFIPVEKADDFSYYLRCTLYILSFLTEIIHNVISLGAMKIFSLIENKAQLFSLFKRKVQYISRVPIKTDFFLFT